MNLVYYLDGKGLINHELTRHTQEVFEYLHPSYTVYYFIYKIDKDENNFRSRKS